MQKRGRKKSFAETELLFFERDFWNFLHRVRDGIPARQFLRMDQFRPDKREVVLELGRKVSFAEISRMTNRWRADRGEPSLPFSFLPCFTQLPKIPGAPKLWTRLKDAHTKKAVQRLSRRLESWGLFGGCRLPGILREHPEELLKAKCHPLYPRKNDNKRIDFLSRWFAGIVLGIPGERTVEHLRKMKHRRECRCWRCFK